MMLAGVKIVKVLLLLVDLCQLVQIYLIKLEHHYLNLAKIIATQLFGTNFLDLFV